MSWKILNVEPEDYNADALAILKEIGTVDEQSLSRAELKETIRQYDVLIVRLGHKIDAEILEAATNLKIILTATTGLNHIDEDEAKKRNIQILSLRGEREFLETITATAEHTMALLLSLVRNIPSSCIDVLQNDRWNRDDFKGIELAGRTMGIIGYGRLGSIVARYANAFGMRVLAHDIKENIDTDTVKFVSMEELLQESDIVSLHVLHSPQTHHLINDACFKSMKKDSIFINTARGEIVDEKALLTALESKHLAGAALDVTAGENSNAADWTKQDNLIAYARSHHNLIITPHIGGATYDSMKKTEIFMAKKLRKSIETTMVPSHD